MGSQEPSQEDQSLFGGGGGLLVSLRNEAIFVAFRGNTHTENSLQVSALLGRIPSAVGYQPTLATDLASLQESTSGSLLDTILHCLLQ